MDKAFFDKKMDELREPGSTAMKILWWEGVLRDSFHPALLSLLNFIYDFGEGEDSFSFVDAEYLETLSDEEIEIYVKGSYDTAQHVLSLVEKAFEIEIGAVYETANRREELGQRIRSLIIGEDVPQG